MSTVKSSIFKERLKAFDGIDLVNQKTQSQAIHFMWVWVKQDTLWTLTKILHNLFCSFGYDRFWVVFHVLPINTVSNKMFHKLFLLSNDANKILLTGLEGGPGSGGTDWF